MRAATTPARTASGSRRAALGGWLLLAILAAAAPGAANEYRIGSGDVVRITVWGHDDLTKDYQVDEAGYVLFPLLGRVEARGTTPKALAALLTERIWLVIQQAGATHLTTLAIGLVAMGLLIAGRRLFPGQPVALGVVLFSLLAVWLGGLDQMGVKIVGDIPAGLPQFQWPASDLAAARRSKPYFSVPTMPRGNSSVTAMNSPPSANSQ